MSNADSPYGPPLVTGDRRSHQSDPSTTPKRRINDSLFNQARWPALIYLWFLLGIALFVYVFFFWHSAG